MSTRIDFNLLGAFEALFAERSVTRAALRHGITQPAMSNALKRLRAMFDDPLFVRGADGLVPTPRAIEAAPTVATALASLRGAVKAEPFDPAHSRARFMFGTLDYLEVLHAPRMIAALKQTAPGVTLQIRRLDTIFQLPQAQLKDGTLDCALGLFPQPLPPQTGLCAEVLGKEEWVCVMRRGHPALAKQLTRKRYAKLPHVGVNYPGIFAGGMIDQRLREYGLSRTCAVWTPHFFGAPFYAASSDCIATTPRGIARAFAHALPLEIVALPLSLPEIVISILWHTRVDLDPAHRWFRSVVGQCVSGNFRQ